ncbi:MAG: hypothetical protein ACKO3P_03775, partial [Planctomycetaceae bacterium]
MQSPLGNISTRGGKTQTAGSPADRKRTAGQPGGFVVAPRGSRGPLRKLASRASPQGGPVTAPRS